MAFMQTVTEHQYLVQDQQYDSNAFFYHQTPYDVPWTTLDPVLIEPQAEVERTQNLHFQTHHHRECLPHQPIIRDWPFPDMSKNIRYMSPSDSYGSSHSDISSSGDSVLNRHVAAPAIRYSTSPVDLHNIHTFSTPNEHSVSHMSWQTLPSGQFTSNPTHMVMPAFLPSQSTLPVKEYEIRQEEDSKLDIEYDEDVVTVQTKPQPEELELSEAHTVSTASSTVGEHVTKLNTAHTPNGNYSENELDEEDELMAVDNDSDSDFTTRPKRRRNSRNGGVRGLKSPRHRRRISNQSILGTKSRIHKRTNSMPTAITTTQNNGRRPSKSKPKPKGPVFTRKPSFPSQSATTKTERVFPCTFHHFGCPAEFPNKNEWKRHVACQHLQLGYYRCDLDCCNPDNTTSTNINNGTPSRSSTQSRRNTCGPKKITPSPSSEIEAADDDEIIKIYNDFNRKDLFTQHCRRMHGPTRNPALCSNPPSRKNGTLLPTKEDEAAFERELDLIRKRCWHVRRKAPARSNCGFCDLVFDASYYSNQGHGHGLATAEGQGPEEKAWEERMEHLGRHYEKEDVRKEGEEMDDDLVKWGLETGVFRRLDDGRVWLISADVPPAGASMVGSMGGEDEDEKKTTVIKARRQPSRTVVVQRRVTAPQSPPVREVKMEEVDSESDSDEDADAETE